MLDNSENQQCAIKMALPKNSDRHACIVFDFGACNPDFCELHIVHPLHCLGQLFDLHPFGGQEEQILKA